MAMHLLEGVENDGTSIREVVLGSPIRAGLAGAAVALGGGLLIAGAVRRKRRVTSKKTRKKRKTTTRRSRRVTHRAPRHRGHKRVTFTTKGGQKVRFLVRGRKRSPKHSRSKSRRFVKGSPEAKRFMAKLRRMKR